MKIKIKYDRNPHQAEFHADTTSKILHLSAGMGSGKTHAICMKSFQLSWINRGLPGGLVVPSIAEFKKDVQPLMEEILDDNKISYKFHKSNNWYQFPWSKGRLYIATAEKKIRGPNWAYALINEATLINQDRFRDVLGRVRIKEAKCGQIAMSGTPEGTHHWLYEMFIEKPMVNSRIIYGRTRDNAQNLAADYVDTMMAGFDKAMQQAYIEGLFVNMQGNRFYYAFDAKNLNEAIEYNPSLEVHVSLDYNVSPMCATLWHIVNIKDAMGYNVYQLNGQPLRKAIAFDTIEIEDNATTDQMCDKFYEYGLNPESTWIYPDPAGNARSTKGSPDNEILKQRGFKNIRSKSIAPQFRKRQLAVNNMFDKGLIEMHPIRCKGLKRDCEAVEQDQLTYEKIKSNPKLTHYSDGMDYFIDIMFPLSGIKPSQGSVKFR